MADLLYFAKGYIHIFVFPRPEKIEGYPLPF